MKRKLAIAALAVVAIALLTTAIMRYSWGEGATPRGQSPLVSLNEFNVSSLKEAFNRSASSVRLLVTLSPT